MLRKTVLSLAAATALAATAIIPTAASAHWYHHHHHYWWGWGPRYSYYGTYPYYDYHEHGCFVKSDGRLHCCP